MNTCKDCGAEGIEGDRCDLCAKIEGQRLQRRQQTTRSYDPRPCSKCGRTFTPWRPGGVGTVCYDCHNAYRRRWYQEHKYAERQRRMENYFKNRAGGYPHRYR